MNQADLIFEGPRQPDRRPEKRRKTMRMNRAVAFEAKTHEGAKAVRISKELELRRTVLACMLWEDTFYEAGVDAVERIRALVKVVPFDAVAEIAIEAREKMKLRHVPLLLARELARQGAGRKMGDLLARIIQRPDELAEFLAIYWKDKPDAPLAAQVKRGLGRAFRKFKEYAIAKYNQGGAVKLRDVLFLSHALPRKGDVEQGKLYANLGNRTFYPEATKSSGFKVKSAYGLEGVPALATPDTWEVELSAGKDKRETFERLMSEKKLGALAFLRNLRNMKEASVPKGMVAAYMLEVNLERVLPFRFVAAALAVPGWEDVIEQGLLRCTAQIAKLSGKSVVIVDVSGSMYAGGNISAKSDMTRVHAAGALAAILREVCEESAIYATAGNDSTRIHATAAVPPRRGMALVEKFTSQGFAATLGGGGIFLVQCMDFVKAKEKSADRVIVLTDEQDCDQKLTPEKADAFGARNYLINVATYRNGIAYGPRWVHIDGWSEAVLEFIRVNEELTAEQQ